MKDITVEIWSDVLCPFCYIGKRHLEQALAEFEDKEQVEIRWKSFELDPEAGREFDGDVYDMLAQKYGVSRDQAKAMNRRVLDMAGKAGLIFNLDAVKPTNSLDAHRIIQLARQHGLQDKAEEKFFKAYFSEGRHLADHDELQQISAEIGLDMTEVREVLNSDKFTAEVRAEEDEARELGVSGVPYFVFNRKYAVSGAQPPELFLDVLKAVSNEDT